MTASTWLKRETTSTGNQKTWTVSVWIRQAQTDNKSKTIFSTDIEDSGTDYCSWSMEAGGIYKFINMVGSSLVTNYQSKTLFIDTTAWYHVVLRVDTTQGTEADRVRLYINGNQQLAWDYSTTIGQNVDTGLWASTSIATFIGARHGSSSPNSWEGEMAHMHIIDGTSYGADTFGEVDSTSGIWKPITSPSVTYGTNGAFLKFQDSAALGDDTSGNGNDYSLVGSGRQSVSTPHNKFPALNPRGTPAAYDTDTYILDSGTTFLGTTGTTRLSMIDMCFAGGNWYWEAKVEKEDAYGTFGVFLTDGAMAMKIFGHLGCLSRLSTAHGSNGAVAYDVTNEEISMGNSQSSYGPSISDGDIIMFAFNATSGKVWLGKNGTWFSAPGTSNVGDPAAGTNDSGKVLVNNDGELYSFYVGGQSSSSTNREIYLNFGHGLFGTTAVSSANSDAGGFGVFEYAVPTGFYALCSKNIQDYGG